MTPLTEAQQARVKANREEAVRRRAASQAAKGLEHFTFGKHSGKSFGEVALSDPDYCGWARNQAAANGQLKVFVDFLTQQQGGGLLSGADSGNKRALDTALRQAAEDAVVKRQRVEAVARPSAPQRRFFRLQRQYLEHIKSGRKRWEGRLNVGAAAGISAGCKAVFSSGTENLEMQVQSVRKYKSFEAMLCDLGVETCLPGVSSLPQGVGIYHSFPGYADKAAQFGVLAMELSLTAPT